MDCFEVGSNSCFYLAGMTNNNNIQFDDNKKLYLYNDKNIFKVLHW